MKLSASVLLLLLAATVESSRILAIVPIPVKSHFKFISSLLEELAGRGHEVTVISPFPRAKPLNNYKDIAVDDYLEGNDAMNMFERRNEVHQALTIAHLTKFLIYNCERFLSYPQIQELIHSDQKFDLIITEIYISECTYGFVHKFNAPFVQISPNTVSCGLGDGVGNPYATSYIPDVLLSYSDHMTFTERLYNTLLVIFMHFFREWFILPQMESIMRKHFKDPNIPTIKEIEANTSFLLLNSIVPLNYPRPFTPNAAEVGGMHIQEPKKLPEELQKYLDEASEGVVYLSFGSLVKSTTMPEKLRNDFIKGISLLKHKILWKWEIDTLPGQPKNVRIEKWFPQNDLLAHPNVKLFITHGGLLSTQEAAYHGVPLVAIPVSGDQPTNAMRAQRAGYAVVLDLDNITADSITWAVNEVIDNPSYRENAQRLSRILKDQPQKPLDRAVFWVEYVIRHNGAPHMRSAALKLNFFQYYCLDVFAVVLLSSLALLAITVLTCKAACRRICSRKTPSVSKSKKNK